MRRDNPSGHFSIKLQAALSRVFLAVSSPFEWGIQNCPHHSAVFLASRGCSRDGNSASRFSATLGQIFLAILSLARTTETLSRPRSYARDAHSWTAASPPPPGRRGEYAVLLIEGNIAPLTSLMSVFLQGFVAGIVGLAAAAFALFIIENEEFRIVTNALGRLVRLPRERSAALAPSAEEPVQP